MTDGEKVLLFPWGQLIISFLYARTKKDLYTLYFSLLRRFCRCTFTWHLLLFFFTESDNLRRKIKKQKQTLTKRYCVTEENSLSMTVSNSDPPPLFTVYSVRSVLQEILVYRPAYYQITIAHCLSENKRKLSQIYIDAFAAFLHCLQHNTIIREQQQQPR